MPVTLNQSHTWRLNPTPLGNKNLPATATQLSPTLPGINSSQLPAAPSSPVFRKGLTTAATTGVQSTHQLAADKLSASLVAPSQASSTRDLVHQSLAISESSLDSVFIYGQQNQSQHRGITAYLLNQYASQRDDIQQMIGIDTFA